MYHKQIIPYLFLLPLTLLLTACSTSPQYYTPTNEQVQEFLQIHKIEPLTIRDVGEFSTVVLVQTDLSNAYYVLHSTESGEVEHSYLGSNNNAKSVPVSVLNGVIDLNFVSLIINDDELFEAAERVDILFQSGRKVTEEVKSRGVIVPSKLKGIDGEYMEIEIYDKNNQLLKKIGR
ncbi:hypothetical protein [Alkalihalobacterium chitinilyticum]|uniref:DUF5067 domain-containing protein n=1 Tax=Alkalihalobacterium chitinilyticum TaxID=2980103 RepID=A0ABT5VI50_9BACI|nr:hypothetical protein [Alkalihalobacterium chitinilyticum]MDE5415131.1 hypothetical protein [Alkalihalobacterium chitinilyticum]